MPERFVPVGAEVRIGKRTYRVVRSTAVMPYQACEGCDFAHIRDGKFPTCPNIACSLFDRVDGVSVWFQEVK